MVASNLLESFGVILLDINSSDMAKQCSSPRQPGFVSDAVVGYMVKR